MTRVNVSGVIAGLLTIALPFLGAWWHLTPGTDALVVSAAPFEVVTSIFGEKMTSPLFWWFCIGLKLGVIDVGSVLLAGSVLITSDDHAAIVEELIRFGSTKLMYLVIMFVAALLIAITLANQSSELVLFRINLPYLIGSDVISVSAEGARITIPIGMKLTWAFGVAVLAAMLGIVARVYQEKR